MTSLNTLSPPNSPIRDRRPSMIDEELTNSVQDILDRCPRFRILVLGKAGAGKSSVINAAFGVTDAHVSHSRVGESDIYQEITSRENPRFVLHDSKGFATGEVNNLQTVKRFIDEKAQPIVDIRDKLHAIWYCIEIPTENGALFEVADSEFMKMDLQKVPVIVVFTKFDLLVSKLEMEAADSLDDDDDELTDDQYREISLKAEDIFQRTCVEPLRKTLADHDIPMIPYIRVSTRNQYKDTLVELTKVTKDQLDEAVWLIWAFAQRASADLKIDACIRIGQRKYWRGLASSLNFPGMTLRKCVEALHNEMVAVWNFDDPRMILLSDDFRMLMSHLVNRMSDGTNPMERLISVAEFVGQIGAAVPTAGLIAVPVAAFAQWVLTVYSDAPVVLRQLMAYITDLTIVMQSLYWIIQARSASAGTISTTRGAVDRRAVRLAFKAYRESGDCTRVHNEIRAFVRSTTAFRRNQRDVVLEKVIELIRNNRFEPPESYKQRSKESGPVLNENEDEYWYFAEPEGMSDLGH